MTTTEKTIKSESIVTNTGEQLTITLTRNAKNREYFRYITNNDGTIEMGFANRKDAVARYERDLANLKGVK